MDSDSNIVVFFDTPSGDGKIWSHHVLRILFAAHYKGIPYSVESIEYPDIVDTFSQTTLIPKDDPIEPYEIPVLKIQGPTGSPQYHMDTKSIIEALENMKPEPSLLYNSPRSVEFRSRFGPAFAPIIQLTVGHVPSILSARSAESFRQKRKNRWGKTVEEWVVEHPPSEGVAKAEPRLKEFGDWLNQTPGPFVNGDKPGYADFAVASFIGFVKAVGLTDVCEEVLRVHPAIDRLYSAVKLSQLGNDRCHYLFDFQH